MLPAAPGLAGQDVGRTPFHELLIDLALLALAALEPEPRRRGE
jgi:hypothetical protein